MATTDSTVHAEFISIPCVSLNKEPQLFSAFYPVILMDGEYDEALRMHVGRSIRMEPLPDAEEALEVARIACLSTVGAIGYTAQGVLND